MFDPNFDPLEELVQARAAILQLQKNEMTLLAAINEQSQLLKELSLQHKELSTLVRTAAREIRLLKKADTANLKG
jgi:mevalonate kinase